MRRGLLLKLSLTAATLAFAVHLVEWSALTDALTRQHPAFIAACLCAIFLQVMFGALRWHALRRALENNAALKAWKTIRIYYASSLFGVVAPSTLGLDVARSILASPSKESLPEIIAGVAIDRIVSLIGLALLVATTLPFLAEYLGYAASAGTLLAALAWAAFALALFLLPRMGGLLARMTRPAFVAKLAALLSRIAAHPKALLQSSLLAMAAHIAYATAAFALARGLGMEITLLQCIVLVPLVLFVSTLPISLGGWGIREASMPFALSLAGAANADSVALAIQLGLMSTLVSLSGTIAYLGIKQRLHNAS